MKGERKTKLTKSSRNIKYFDQILNWPKKQVKSGKTELNIIVCVCRIFPLFFLVTILFTIFSKQNPYKEMNTNKSIECVFSYPHCKLISFSTSECSFFLLILKISCFFFHKEIRISTCQCCVEEK